MSETERASEAERLDTEEVARRLGVKRETVYAYVSRGLLARHPASSPHHSEFDREEVERLAARARRPDRSSALEVVVETELTLLEPEGRLSYRGRDAIELAKFRSFEEVVALLWDGAPPTPWELDEERAAAIEALGAALGPEAPAAERIPAVVATLAARDPERDDRDPDAVRRAGADVFAGILAALDDRHARTPSHGQLGGGACVPDSGRGEKPSHSDSKAPQPAGTAGAADNPRALTPSNQQLGGGECARVTERAAGDPERGRGSMPGGGIAGRLWLALAPGDAKPRPEQVAGLNAALILLADHELAASTFATRVAASAWAGPYRVILAGLGPLGGSLHGGAGLEVEALLDQVTAGTDPGAALDARIATGGVPGFGHRVYRDRDPRADHLLDRLGIATLCPLSPPGLQRTGGSAAGAAEAVLVAAAERELPAPNVDFALAALVKAQGLRAGSSPTIFTVARIAGIVAHALEEYEYRLRFRPRASYVGPMPPAI